MAITGNDLLEKSKKNKKKENEAVSGEDLINRLKTYQSTDTSSVDQKYIDSFRQDSNTFLTTADKDYGGVGWANASSFYDSRNSTWEDLNTRADAIGAWLHKNRNSLESDVYKSLSDELSSFRSSGSSIIDTFKSAVDYYSQWETEDEYNKWYEDYKAKQEMASSAEGKQGWEKYLADQELAKTAKDEESFWEKIGRYLTEGGGVTDTSLPMGTTTAAMNAVSNDDSYRLPQADWSEEQQRIFGYLYHTSPGEAYKYAISTNNQNKKASEEEALKKIAESATSNFWAGAAHTIGAIASAPLGLADYLSDLVNANAGRPITSDGIISPFEYSQAVTGGITTKLNDMSGTIDDNVWMLGGKGLGDLYGLGTSIAQSMASAYTMGSTGTLISYFGQGAASGVDEALSRGATDGQALLYGTSLGVFEGLAEMVGVDNLFKLGSTTTVKGFIKNILNQAGAEGLEEGLTAFLSNIADNVIMGDKSNFNFLVAQYMAEGMSEEEAQDKAWLTTVGGIVFDTLAGAVSGGVSGGIHTTANTIASNVNAKNLYGNGADLVNKTLDIDANNAYAQKMKGKVDKGNALSGGQINRLIETNEQTRNTRNLADIASELEAKGMSPEEARKTAEWLYKAADGEVYTRKQQKAYANDDRISDVHRDIFTNKENSVYKRNAEYDALYDLAQNVSKSTDAEAKKTTSDSAAMLSNDEVVRRIAEATGVDADVVAESLKRQAETSPSVENTSVEPSKAETSFNVSDDGKARLGDTEITIKEIASIKDGEVMLRLNDGSKDGSTVKASEVTFSSNEEGLLYENVIDMGLNAVTANTFVKGFDGSMSVADYVQGFSNAYRYGELGISKKELSSDEFASRLTDSVKNLAYNHGSINAKYKATEQEKVNKSRPKVSAEKKSANRTKYEKKGEIHNTAIKKSEVYKSLSPLQKAGVDGMIALYEGLGIDVYFFVSPTDAKGNRTGKNGYFVPEDGSVHIDLYAGLDGRGTILFTGGHELSHYIREKLPSQFKAFADILFDKLEQKGVNVSELIAKKKSDLESIGRITPDMTEQEAYDLAYEETVADACESMLADGKAFAEIAQKVKAKNKNLWEAIKQFFTDLVAKIKKAYEGLRPDSPVGNYVADMLATAEELRSMWVEMLVEASEIESAVGKVIEANAKPISNDEILTDGAVVTDGKGNKYSIRSMKHDISDGQMFRDLMTHCGFTKEQVGELRTQLEDLVEYMNPFRDIVDLNETYDMEGRRYAPYKPNSDPLYTISLDFSTQCSKRLLTQYVIEQLQLRENRPMSPEEQMAIRDMLKEYGKVEKGIQVACVMCYVEAARLKAPKQIQKWLDDPATAMRNFFADKNPEFSAYIKEKQADFKESKGYDRNATKKEMSAKDRTALNKIRPKVRAEYKPSAEEMAIIETASNLPNSTYLTAGNLADLSETHPEIYKAYTAFIRTATRSKALETDEPYYYGDSTRDNGNGIIVSDSFIEAVNRENGMRFSSWSDWRIQHLLDWITAVIDNSVRGAAMHGYTKYGDEVRVLGNTGMMFNMSGVAGTQTGLNEDGSLNFSETESMDYDEAIALREEFPETAGLQCIGVGVDHIFALLRSDVIDYVIPYHTSGLNATLRRMGDIYGWKDFTQTQHAIEDKSIKKENAVDPDNWHKEPVFSEFFVGYDTGLGGVEAMRESAENYKRMCRERGLIPKFNEFANEPNYWKLLIDRKMVNQKTNTLIQQKAVTPNFDFGVIKGIVDKYVANYDSGLEQRAFNHIVENWDNIPKRIRDLKKQGGTKAKKTKKAVDTIANETLAVQPKKEKASDRVIDQDGVYDLDANTIATDFATHVVDLVKSRGYWYPSDVTNYVDQNPELNFVERIFSKDKTVKADLAEFLGEVEDPQTLHIISWYVGEAYKKKDLRYDDSNRLTSPYQGAVRTFRNAIDKRINEIMTAKNNGTNLGVKNGEVSVQDVKDLFFRLNGIEEMNEFAEKVFGTAEKLGVNIRFTNTLFSKKTKSGDALGDMVEFKTSYFNDTAITDQRKAKTILHELIHTCTTYVLAANQFMGDVYYPGKSKNYEMIANAATRINRIFGEIRLDSDLRGQYGTKNTREFVAELANPEFVELLKKKTLWDKIVDWVCELFGFKRSNSVYDNVRMCVDYILDNPDIAEYKSYALEARKTANRDHGGAFGSTVLEDGQVRYSDRVLMGSLFSGGGTLEAGLAYQMLDKEFGVEYDGKIASVYADNHGDHIQVGKVEDFDISKYDDIFYLHASPVCHNFSKAKHGATELQMDIDSAMATAKHLETAMPQVFTVENAPGYRKSESLKIITDKLTELGYKWDVDVYNSADYGSATSRNRVILRAVKDAELPAKPTKQERTNSWDKVTRDLWDTLPKSYLRPSFISAIENTPKLPILDADGKVNVNKPLLILTTTSGHTVTYCWEGEICPTLTTKCGEAKLVMPDGNIYAVTPEFMGRIQGLPDDYKYPKAKTRAFTIIGNGIPTHLTKAVVGGVLDSAYEQTHDGKVLYSDRNNVGYHAGDLGKAEYYPIQGYDRDTGHFGTGTYFVGNEEKISGGYTYGNRPHHAVDFSDYNLYKVKSDQDGWELHDQLRVIDGGISQEWLTAAKNNQFMLVGMTDVYDLAEERFGDDKYTEEARISAILELAEKHGIELLSNEEFSKKHDIPLDDEYFTSYYLDDYLERAFKEEAEKINSAYRAFEKAYFNLWLRFGMDKTDRALQKVLSHQQEIDPDSHRTPYNEKQKNADSLATVFMKALGYEGIDVRGTRLDNTTYGSVIYDLKEDTVLWQDRSTESFSNRTLLANALESVAQNDIERNKLAEYKSKIALIESEQAKLAEIRAKIKELSFAKRENRDDEAKRKLQFEEKQTANRINTYDKQLLNLEATKALKGVLEREKQMAYKRAEQKGREALKEQREKDRERNAKTQRELLTRYQESRKKGIEGRQKTETRYKIKKVVNELNQYLKGTKEKHVPIQLQRPVTEALRVVNMDTVGAEQRIAHKRELMRIAAAKGDMDKVTKLAKEIDHIQEMGENLEAKLSKLQTAYDSILQSDDPLVQNAHDEVISNTIAKVIEVVGDTPIRDMSLYQLESVYDMYKMVLANIRKANKAHASEKSEEISTIANGVIAELKEKKRKSQSIPEVMKPISAFDWNNLKPVYAFERIGSANLTKVFNRVLDAEGVWATDMDEASKFRIAQQDKYGFKSWDFDKKYEFASTSGEKFELTLNEIMALYAWAKDEDAKTHLFGDGFQFDPHKKVVKKKGLVKLTYYLENATSYKLSQDILDEITATMTQEQRDFADAMQDYLATTMGEKGNEVSLALYEIKLFKNKVYFPLKVSHQFLAVAKEQAEGKVRVKNKGFTNERKKNAKNTVILSSFMDVWTDHVQEMSMYHAFTLPLEDFRRVIGYSTPSVSEDTSAVGVRSELINAHGNAAEQYLDQLFDDINGGAKGDPRETLAKSLVSRFKKASVVASLSVTAQQPTAIVRAMALVNPKYFGGKRVNKGKIKEKWQTMKKYAPVCIIKEMGGFDTGMSMGAVEWLKGEKTFMDKVDDALGLAPEFADKVTWIAIWNAVERETVHKNKNLAPNSEEFLKAVGERFTEVIRKTQVYDSTLARSANMRSKGLFMTMLTSFMAEPTTSINMLADAFRRIKSNPKYFARTMGAVYGSVVLNSAIVSLIYAMRDDDEDETYLEKYVSRFVTEVVDGVNPLTYIPGVKDVWSIAQGFDVERADMSLVTKVFDSLQQVVKVTSKDTSDMDEEELDEHYKAVAEAWLSVGDNITSLFGLPVKNIRRDINGVINLFKTLGRDQETTAGSLGDNIAEDLKDSIPVWGWLPDKSKGDKLYDAIKDGDKDYIERMKEYYEYEHFYTAAVEEGPIMAQAVKEVIIQAKVDEGKTLEEAEESFVNGVTSYIKKRFEEGDLSHNEAMDMLIDFCGLSTEEAEVKVQYWEYKQDNPDIDVEASWFKKYSEDVSSSGISIDMYINYRTKTKGIEADKDANGNTISGSRKAKVMAIINSLPISNAQKDALYFAEGWSASTLWEAPWH